MAEHYWTAWTSCWTGVSKALDFHAKMKIRPAFAIPQGRDLKLTRLSRKFARVNIPKVGAVKFRYHRPVPQDARITGATVSSKNGLWTLSLKVKCPSPSCGPLWRPAKWLDSTGA